MCPMVALAYAFMQHSIQVIHPVCPAVDSSLGTLALATADIKGKGLERREMVSKIEASRCHPSAAHASRWASSLS